MKAMRIHGWGEPPRLEELPGPVPQPDRTLVQMAATTASHLDRSIAAGGFLRHPPLPYVPGVEAAGTVLQSERFDLVADEKARAFIKTDDRIGGIIGQSIEPQ